MALISERLAQQAPENADYARDLWVSYWKVASSAEEKGDQAQALNWWRKAYAVLSKLKERGLFLSAEDEGLLRQLAAKMEKE